MSIYISASGLKDYLNCSKQLGYRLFESEKAESTIYQTIGLIAHKAIEKHWDNQIEAVKFIESASFKVGLDFVNTEKIKFYIDKFFKDFRPLLYNNDGIEKRFKLKIADDVFLVGVFDRITQGLIFDWKTTNRPPQNIDSDVQFVLYHYAYENLYNKKPLGLYFASLYSGKLISYHHNQNYQELIFNEILPQMVYDIRKKNFIKEGIFKKTCYMCNYKKDCLKEINGLAS